MGGAEPPARETGTTFFDVQKLMHILITVAITKLSCWERILFV